MRSRSVFHQVSALFLATIIYYVERLELEKGYAGGEDGSAPNCDPELGYPADEQCPAFPDIGAAIWFMIVTYTTVGYGDVWPHSHSGKTVAVLAMVWGLIISAMPIAIVANAFSQAWEERTTSKVVLRVQKHCIEHGAQLHAIQVPAPYEAHQMSEVPVSQRPCHLRQMRCSVLPLSLLECLVPTQETLS